MPKPSWFDWITLFAVLCGPVFALLAQRALDYIREKKKLRVAIYTTLMSLRAQPLHPEHVRALNSIDAIFDRRRDKEVRERWGKVLAHMSTDPKQQNWNVVLLDLRVDLYQAISKAVGYDHSVDYIKNRIYSPVAYEDIESQMCAIREGLAHSLTNEGIKVVVTQETNPNRASEID